MQDCELQMLEALRAHLSKDTPACILESAEDWTGLWTLSSQQKILGMVVDGLAPVLPKEAIGPSVRGNVLQGAAVQLQKTMAFQNLYQGLLDRGFTPVVVKGILCRSLYPKPDLRPSADEDLLIRQEEMAGVLEYLRCGGMILEHEEDEQARNNRRLLYHTMKCAGFESYSCEWWHFAYGERMWAMFNQTTPHYGFHPSCKE